MNRRSFLLQTALALGSCGAFAKASSGRSKGSTLEVHATYAGSGTVDDAHRFYVAVWDTPDFVKDGNSSKPIATARVTSKSGTLTFDDLQKTPVFISMAYDATGKWTDPSSDVPSGTSLGMYSKDPGTPAPVDLEPGKTTKVSAELDDSYQKP
jgi:hypothetical protein